MASGGLTGILLVGGSSRRFGSPKPLAELNGETLAARAWRTLSEFCEDRVAAGKAEDRLPFPFEILAILREFDGETRRSADGDEDWPAGDRGLTIDGTREKRTRG
jgi:hypothetical protein